MYYSNSLSINIDGLHFTAFALDDSGTITAWVPADSHTDRQIHDD